MKKSNTITKKQYEDALQFSKEHINICKAKGTISIVNTKLGVLNIDFKDGVFVFTTCNGRDLRILLKVRSESMARVFLISQYQFS